MVSYIKKHKVTTMILIYAIYISLGVPDSLLGVVWPTVRSEFGVPIYYGGIVMSIVAVLAALSSISYSYFEKKFNIENIVVMSCFLTSLGLLMMGLAQSFTMICVASIPLGIGAGAVDSSLNNFVSENLSSKHMIWLHGFWGIGAIIGPFIYSVIQEYKYPWQYSALIVALFQILLTIILYKNKYKMKDAKIKLNSISTAKRKTKKFSFIVRILQVFIFSGFDVSINLWLATYLQEHYRFKPEIAGVVMALYFGSVMAGRFVGGTLSEKIKLSKMITYGLILSIVGVCMLAFIPNETIVFIAIPLIGAGMCVVYPFTMFENHILFEKKDAQKLISYQVAVNFVGSLILPFAIGVGITYYSIHIYIFIQLMFLIITLLLRVCLNRDIDYDVRL